MSDQLLGDLARAKALFQQRAVCAHMGFIAPAPAGRRPWVKPEVRRIEAGSAEIPQGGKSYFRFGISLS